MAKKLTVKHIIGSTPEGQAAEWMTQEDWDKYDAYIEECKKNGTYGKEQEVIIELQDDCFFDNKKGLILDTNTEMIEFKPLSKIIILKK